MGVSTCSRGRRRRSSWTIHDRSSYALEVDVSRAPCTCNSCAMGQETYSLDMIMSYRNLGGIWRDVIDTPSPNNALCHQNGDGNRVHALGRRIKYGSARCAEELRIMSGPGEAGVSPTNEDILGGNTTRE